jgi:hypothetical protein
MSMISVADRTDFYRKQEHAYQRTPTRLRPHTHARARVTYRGVARFLSRTGGPWGVGGAAARV